MVVDTGAQRTTLVRRGCRKRSRVWPDEIAIPRIPAKSRHRGLQWPPAGRRPSTQLVFGRVNGPPLIRERLTGVGEFFRPAKRFVLFCPEAEPEIWGSTGAARSVPMVPPPVPKFQNCSAPPPGGRFPFQSGLDETLSRHAQDSPLAVGKHQLASAWAAGQNRFNERLLARMNRPELVLRTGIAYFAIVCDRP